jgi:hypothetical protein
MHAAQGVLSSPVVATESYALAYQGTRLLISIPGLTFFVSLFNHSLLFIPSVFHLCLARNRL